MSCKNLRNLNKQLVTYWKGICVILYTVLIHANKVFIYDKVYIFPIKMKKLFSLKQFIMN